MSATVSVTDVMPLKLSAAEPTVDAALADPEVSLGATSRLTLEPPSSNLLEKIMDTSVLETSAAILHIIDKYRLRSGNGTGSSDDEGRFKFLTITYKHVKAGRPVPMCLPAFPFKSPNSTRKVLGVLPDKAEEFALAHLNGLCHAIEGVYPPGAKLTIISDGLVYNGMWFLPRPPRA